MDISFSERNAIAGMADTLAELLPFSGGFEHRGQVTYRSIARDLGIGAYWVKMSKRPGIATMIERILEYRREMFEPFILKAVSEGIKYRQKEQRPIRQDEIQILNGHILDVGFKFPALWDPDFLKSLEIGSAAKAKANVEKALAAESLKAADQSTRDRALEELKIRFYSLVAAEDRQAAGLELERILNKLFHLFDLDPQRPFRIMGEQIDGSFCLDHEVYLVEAKWEREPLNEAPLLVFQGKVGGKSQFSRGVFISIGGISSQAQDSITRGKQPNFFLMDGYDLSLVLEGSLDLAFLLRKKFRYLADHGSVMLSGRKLL
jgi:hypothetical protein